MALSGTASWAPRGLAGWLIRSVLPAEAEAGSADTRIRLGMLEGWTSMAVSVVFSGAKLIFGLLTGSIAVLADGINNLADVGSSLVIALSFRWSHKPRDRRHPFGHGRVETVAALVLSIALIMVGFDLATESIRRLLKPQPVDARSYVMIILAVTIVVKQWLALFARKLATVTGSPVLRADFWNHQFDVLSTSVVVLALITIRWGWLAVDGWAGLFVSGFILYTGFRYARESIHTLVGEAPSAEEVEAIRKTAASQAGVRDVHDIIVHTYGDMKLVSLHIEVDAARTALEVHDLAEEVEKAVCSVTGCRAIVHVDPVDRRHPMYVRARRLLEGVVGGRPEVKAFHDLRVSGDRDRFDLSVDLVVGMEVDGSAQGGIAEDVKVLLKRRLSGVGEVRITIEQPFSEEKMGRA